MNKLDIFLLIPIALGFIIGLYKGLIKELTSLLAIVLGIYGAKLWARDVSDFLIHKLDFSGKTALPIAYLLVFITIAILLLILANMLGKVLDSISLSGLNKILGGIFGGLKYALILSVLMNFFEAIDSKFSIISKQTKEKSFGYKPILNFGPTLWEETKEEQKSNISLSDEKNKTQNK